MAVVHPCRAPKKLGRLAVTFPTRSFEQVFTDVCGAGYKNGFTVIPEFSLAFAHPEIAASTKKPDVAWLATLNAATEDVIPLHRVVAVFEVEGFNAPELTIAHHSTVYPAIWRMYGAHFPCYVPLYSLARHRPGYGANADAVNQGLLDLQGVAARHGDVIQVCDGRARPWLQNAVLEAVALANQWREGQQ
jgi:hypothetical protein